MTTDESLPGVPRADDPAEAQTGTDASPNVDSAVPAGPGFMPPELSLRYLISEGWTLLKATWRQQLLLSLAMAGILLAILVFVAIDLVVLDELFNTEMLDWFFEENNPVLNLAGSPFGAFAFAYAARLRRNPGYRFKWVGIGRVAERTLTQIVMTVVISIAIIIGFVLLVVPGIMLMLGWSLAQTYCLDYGAGIRESLEGSWAITSGYKRKLMGWNLGLILFSLSGVLLLGVGVLVTISIAWCAWVVLYDELARRKFGEPTVGLGQKANAA